MPEEIFATAADRAAGGFDRILDALETVQRGLSMAALTAADYDTFSVIMEADGTWPYLLDEVAQQAGVRLTPSVVAAGIGWCVVAWQSGGREALALWDEVPTLCGCDPVLTAAHGLAWSAAAFELDRSDADMVTAALGLADAFADADRADDAVAAALTALNFATTPEEELRCADTAIRVAVVADNHEVTAIALARRAHALAYLGDAARLAAFDAVAAALRCLPDNQAHKDIVGVLLKSAIAAADHLAGYRRYVWWIFDNPTKDETRELSDHVDRLFTPEWHLDTADAYKMFSFASAGGVDLERARERLVDPGSTDAAFADWTTLSFDHPAYRSAIPHGGSVRRESGFDGILLTIGHETTHVLSMLGDVGFATFALRAAAAELEVALWAFASELPTTLLAPLDTTSLLALTQAEQSLDIARKRQILQATWLPWFEGIAVFGESAADPTAEADSSAVGDVLVNFVDDPLLQGDEADIYDRLMARQTTEEERYAAAQRGEGRSRLRGYLVEAPDKRLVKYLAGYLAVRQVVARWRTRAPLLGAQAYRLLLHRTRYDTARAVPDLSLPTERFRQEAERLMLDWMAGLGATHRTDIDRFLSLTGKNVRWHEGTPVHDDRSAEAVSELAGDRFRKAVRSALATNLEPSTASRVADADAATTYLVRQCAPALAHRDPNLHLTNELGAGITRQGGILPLGHVTCPFWLDAATRRIVCLIRTTENHAETGQSSYDMLVSPLGDDYAALVDEVANRREPRLTIYRMADLRGAQPVGRQFLVLRYGDWTHIQNRGSLTGSDLVPDELRDAIDDRLTPSTLVRNEAEQLATFAPAARRTLEWLDRVDTWTVGEVEVTVDAWTSRVRRLAEDVLADPHAADVELAACRRLLEPGFGSDVDDLVTQGIRCFNDGAPMDLSRIVATLADSGRQPVGACWLDDEPENAAARRLFARGPCGWDVKDS
jgi:hypothetical protein